jgi:hypothetical protein
MTSVWFRGNPRLWYRDDLINHPELIPLEGQEVTIERGNTFHKVYPGAKLLTEEVSVMKTHGFENQDLVLSYSPFKGLYNVGNIFGEALTTDNLFKVADQWLMPETSLSTEASVEINFKHKKHIPVEYWIIPAFGTSDNPIVNRPTPRSWKLMCSNDGEKWTTAHTVKNYDKWDSINIQQFKVTKYIRTPYSYMKLVITEWNPGEEPNLEVGLRRFWLFGRPDKNIWLAPNLPSPDPAFVYVIPRKDILHSNVRTKDVRTCLAKFEESQQAIVNAIKELHKK